MRLDDIKAGIVYEQVFNYECRMVEDRRTCSSKDDEEFYDTQIRACREMLADLRDEFEYVESVVAQ